MNCHEYEPAIVDIARGVPRDAADEQAARAHLAECGTCAARLRRETSLSSGLRALAATAELPDGARLEVLMLERFDVERARAARRAARSARWLAAAAAVVMTVGLAAAWRTVTSEPPADAYTVAAQSEEGEFIPWPGAAALPAFESGQLVRTKLPASVLPLLGIAQADGPVGGRVTADVLYGQDGLARAVRLVRTQSMQP